MLIVIEQLFSETETEQMLGMLLAQSWQSGSHSAGDMAKQVKSNQQLADSNPLCQTLGNRILQRLMNHPEFVSAALPEQVYPPKFNRYEEGGAYGLHVDGAIMGLPDSHKSLRTDLSATLFLTSPEDYQGGELMIEDQFGAQAVKLPAGDLVLYPSSSLHQVNPVQKGARISAFFWIQSLVRDPVERSLLYDLDQSIQGLRQREGNEAEALRLSGIYHNLLRRWAQP